MLAFWESKINIKNRRARVMNLGSILGRIKASTNLFNLNDSFKTIRYISDEEYEETVHKYVEPMFMEPTDSETCQPPRFILFSAPGATGKTALAKEICHSKHGIYWDLPDSKVAEFSLQGAIQNAVGVEYLSDFYKSIKNGDEFLVIDAFDEAEAGSGRTGIEFFLRDLNTITDGCDHICAILMARTESALFIKNYLLHNNIPFIHYEVGYFAEYNAKTYIKNGLERLKVPITGIVNQCIDSQFNEIKRILLNTNTESFLGYAPVLNALSASYDEERNTLNLLRNTKDSDNNCQLLKRILDDLLVRERGKFLNALKIKLPKINVYSDNIYNKKEQILRIFGTLAYNDSTLFVPNIDESIPIEYHEEYLEAVNTQLYQHPFVKVLERKGEPVYDFTGTAFRDFVIAFVLADKELTDFVREYISDCNKYCPSQLLVEFYNIFSEGKIDGNDIPLMYNSFKAHAQVGDKINLHINGDSDECSVEFIFEKENLSIESLEFEINDLENGIYIDQLSNCYVDVDGKVYVGSSKSEARIYNSVINCNTITWRSEKISIEAYSPGECSLVVDNMDYTTDTLPMFEVKTDDKRNFKVTCDNLKGYYKLIPYHTDDVKNNTGDDYTFFANLIRRIFSCLRSHSKDAPARKADFINNRIISLNSYKKNVLAFLLDTGILYTDEQNWLYKLNTDKLSTYSIKWHDVRDGDFASLESLYEMYKNSDKATALGETASMGLF